MHEQGATRSRIRPARLIIFLLCTMLGACASFTGEAPRSGLSGPALETPAGPRWFQLRFRNTWPAGTKPRWEQDLLLAERVIRPLLAVHERRLYRWRFHRRAARTPSGHQFSFIFFTDAATAASIHADAEADPTVLALFDAGRLDRLILDDTGGSDLAATSDPKWPEHVQRHWPIFIMGASALWLELIGECDGSGRSESTLADQLAHYGACHTQITRDWHKWAQHAYLHHLSGIFGYPYLRMRKDIRF